jgi:hypothetical protein
MVVYTHLAPVEVCRQNGALPVCAAAICATAASAVIAEATSVFVGRPQLLPPAQLLIQMMFPSRCGSSRILVSEQLTKELLEPVHGSTAWCRPRPFGIAENLLGTLT